MKKTITLIVTAILVGGTAQATVKPQQCEKPQVSQPVQVKTEVSQKVEQRVRVRVSQNQKQAQKQQQSRSRAIQWKRRLIGRLNTKEFMATVQ